jgi:hypothetical protein
MQRLPQPKYDGRWGRKVGHVCRTLMVDFGPFLLRGKRATGGVQQQPKQQRKQKQKQKQKQQPLVHVDDVREALLGSEPMWTRLHERGSSRAYEYVLWVNARIGASREMTPAGVARSLRAVAARYGVDAPLFLGSPHAPPPGCWATNAVWIDEFLQAFPGAARPQNLDQKRAARGAARRGQGGGSSGDCAAATGTERASGVPAAVTGIERASGAPATAFWVDNDERGAGTLPSARSDEGSPLLVKVLRARSARKSLPQAVRHAVWNAWTPGGAKAGEGACASCGRSITQQDYDCGHVVARACGGSDTVDNLRPVCRPCNTSMGTVDMRDFVAKHFPHRRVLVLPGGDQPDQATASA